MNRRRIGYGIGMLFMLMVLLFKTVTIVEAAPKSEWVEKKGVIYYYDSKGKTVKGSRKIDGQNYTFDNKGKLRSGQLVTTKKGYRYQPNLKGKIQKGFVKNAKNQVRYFDKQGIMQTGWNKIKNDYYYFSPKTGLMSKNKSVNGIALKKTGKAARSAKTNEKLNTLVSANQIVQSITWPAMTKSQKLRICFDYTAGKPYKTLNYPFNRRTGWECMYADDIFIKGGGTCYAYGAAYAFLADACGAKDVYACSSIAHGWAEVNGLIYDPERHRATKGNYYARPYTAFPGYKAVMRYHVRI